MITVDPGSTVPPYEQVRAQFAARIASGELTPGTKLPTVRRLADDLGLAVNTVARAYRELESAGLVVTRGRAGTLVDAVDAAHAHARDAAQDFARAARSAGMGADEALRMVRAALDPSADSG